MTELTEPAKVPAKVNLAQKFTLFSERWSPRIVGELNDSYVKLAKLEGEFLWHHHEHEDELFLVISGRLRMKYRDGEQVSEVVIEPGEFLIVPKRVEHCPVAEGEVHLLLLEPKSTQHTGSIQSERTVNDQPWI